MIIASYPRSGNAMVRIALHYCYGLTTRSVYPENMYSEYYQRVVNANDDAIVCKTHKTPPGPVGEPCLVIVRDPRRVFISLQRYYSEVSHRDYSMEAMIEGDHPFGDWSDWIKAWVQYAPPNTLWVRYENFYPELIRAWFNIPQIGNDMPSLKELRANDPVMFKEGRTDGRGCLPKHEKRIFERHGSVMTMLGYER